MRGSGSLLILLTLLGHHCSVSTLYSDVSQDVVISGHLDQDDKMTRSSRPLETISTFPVSKNDKYYKESHSTQCTQGFKPGPSSLSQGIIVTAQLQIHYL